MANAKLECMALPAFNDDGDLPPGVYCATLREVRARFGEGSAQREAVAERLDRIYWLAQSTGKVTRFVVFGSFVTDEPYPNDVDIVMLMDDTFDLGVVSDDVALLFHHADADAYFGASIFWTRELAALGGAQDMIEYWQTRRDGRLRGIVEITGDA
ncbi:MAG TPA: hypothetical protein VFW87_08490 [Pirellulales bacterium]|nr:hypothetical protein [Pirellulales bacterium]